MSIIELEDVSPAHDAETDTTETYELTPDELRRLDDEMDRVHYFDETPKWLEELTANIDWREEEMRDLYRKQVQRLLGAEVSEDDLDAFIDHSESHYSRGGSEKDCARAWLTRTS
jgi:hypothetical protein